MFSSGQAVAWVRRTAAVIEEHAAALPVIQEQIGIYRTLAEEKQDAFWQPLGKAMNALAVCFERLGRYEESAAVTLSKGFLPITVQYENVIFSGTLRLFWAPPGKPGEIIPPEFLFSR